MGEKMLGRSITIMDVARALRDYGPDDIWRFRKEMAKAIDAHLATPAQTVDVSDANISEWSERHDLNFGGSKTDARCAFEDARTFTTALTEKGNG